MSKVKRERGRKRAGEEGKEGKDRGERGREEGSEREGGKGREGGRAREVGERDLYCDVCAFNIFRVDLKFHQPNDL